MHLRSHEGYDVSAVYRRHRTKTINIGYNHTFMVMTRHSRSDFLDGEGNWMVLFTYNDGQIL